MVKIEEEKCKECQRCGMRDDIISFEIAGDTHFFCSDCILKLLVKRDVGRPSVGVTKKVSITLTENEWKWIDEQASTRSEAFRNVVKDRRTLETIVVGYMILAAQKLGYEKNEILKLDNRLHRIMRSYTIEEAKKAYRESLH